MPRIPGPAEIADTSLRVTRRGVQVRADQSGAALTQVADAASQVLTRVRDAQIESEVRSADLEYALDLDKERRALEADPDYETFEQRFGQRAEELRGQYAERLRSPMHRRLWDARAQQRAAEGTVAVRDLARRKGVEGAVAGLVRQEGLARQVIDDDGAAEKLRAESVESYTAMVRNMVSRGIVGADDGERMIGTLGEYYRKKGEDRSVVAGAQTAADAVFADPKLETLDAKLAWVRENVPEGRARAAAEDEVAQRFQRQRVAREEQEEQDRIEYMRAENGDGVLSTETRARLEATQPDFLQARQDRNRARFREGVSNLEAQRRLDAMRSADRVDGIISAALTDPAKMKLLADATPEQLSRAMASLEPDDALRLSQFRAKALGRGDGADATAQQIERVFSDLKTRAEPIAQLRLDSYGGEKGKGATNKAQLQRYLFGVARSFVQRYGRAPTESELEAMVNRAFEEQRTRNEFGDNFDYRFGRPPPLPLTEEEAKP